MESNKKNDVRDCQHGRLSEDMCKYIYHNAATYDEAMKLYYEMMHKPEWIVGVCEV